MTTPSLRRLTLSLAVALPLAAAPALAQGTTTLAADSTGTNHVGVAPTTFVAPALPAGPTADGAAVATAALRRQRSERQTAEEVRRAMQQRGQGHGTAAALMVVGGAAIVLGLLVDGDAQAPLIVGGAVVGGLGLYQYLR